MALKFCDSCRTTYPIGDKDCKNKCKSKKKKKSDKEYDKYSRKNAKVYHSKEWQRVRQIVIARDSICLWSYYIHKKIVRGSLVHHIVEVNEDKMNVYNPNNLVYLSSEAHREVHDLYKSSKRKTQSLLFQLVKERDMGR